MSGQETVVTLRWRGERLVVLVDDAAELSMTRQEALAFMALLAARLMEKEELK